MSAERAARERASHHLSHRPVVKANLSHASGPCSELAYLLCHPSLTTTTPATVRPVVVLQALHLSLGPSGPKRRGLQTCVPSRRTQCSAIRYSVFGMHCRDHWSRCTERPPRHSSVGRWSSAFPQLWTSDLGLPSILLIRSPTVKRTTTSCMSIPLDLPPVVVEAQKGGNPHISRARTGRFPHRAKDCVVQVRGACEGHRRHPSSRLRAPAGQSQIAHPTNGSDIARRRLAV